MKREIEACLERLNISNESVIEYTLERVKKVNDSLGLEIKCPLIIVGGTNGKGSTCSFLSSIYKESGFRVGTFTSPHLLEFNERIKINNISVSNEEIIKVFEKIAFIKGDIILTFFEITLIAAVYIFLENSVDLIILEVGLGGRLDAVNIYDADVSIITNVDLDHQDYLGNTREEIAFEKAGILRTGKFAIFGDINPPNSLLEYSSNIGANLLLYGEDFYFESNEFQWIFKLCSQKKVLGDCEFHALPLPSLKGGYQFKNASCALVAIEALNDKLSVDMSSIKKGILSASNFGRFQILPGRPMVILDVAHNIHAASELKKSLVCLPFARRKVAIFSILKDKNIDGVLGCLKDEFDEWLISELDTKRSISINNLIDSLRRNNISNYKVFSSIKDAYNHAIGCALEEDRIVVFGSFYAVADVCNII